MLCVAAFVLVAVPVTDVFAFGIHEHTTTVDQKDDADDVTQPDHSGHMLSHHCDLSVTPGGLTPHPDVPGPTLVAFTLIDVSSSFARYTPFLLSPPPRS